MTAATPKKPSSNPIPIRPSSAIVSNSSECARVAGIAISRIPSVEAQQPPPPAMVTIAIQGGRHDRLRPGDIVGALTTGVGIVAADIGQITVNDRISFVAVAAAIGRRALDGLTAGRIWYARNRLFLIRPPR